METDILYKIAITMIPGVGGSKAKKLISAFGSAQAIFDTPLFKLNKYLNTNTIQNFNKLEILKQAEKELEFISRNNIRVLFYTDNDYPYKLTQCEDAPVTLYVKGDIDFNSSKFISIVGTRNASPYGLALCKKLVLDLEEKGYKPVIVSGLAYGIDVCAHTAALNSGFDTVAVLATAINKIYPAAHKSIASQIEKQGALVTEFVSETATVQGNFVSRNRIIAGLSDVTIVVESKQKGGALLTAEMANAYNREVMAFPGRVGDENSQGCNNLIKANKAAMIESLEDLEYQMNWSATAKPQQKQLNLAMLTPPEQEIMNFLKNKDSEHIDVIASETGISLPELSAFLLNMEFSGYLIVLPGNSYSIAKI